MDERWVQLGQELMARRIEVAGHSNRSRFAKENDLPNDRVLYDLEKARRNNFDQSTLAHMEAVYRLRPGAIGRFVAGDGLDVRPSRQDDSYVAAPGEKATVTLTEDDIAAIVRQAVEEARRLDRS